METDAIEKRFEKIELGLEKIKERPPIWVTWVMTGGGTIIGALAKWLFECMQLK